MDVSLIIFFAAILVVGVALIVIISLSRHSRTVLDVEKYRSRWLAIEQSLKRDDVSSYHLSVLNADKLVDRALKERGVQGATMGERMKTAKQTWSDRNGIWMAHKLRNQIAHEPDVAVGYDDTRRALASFKKALKDLGAI